MANNQRGRCRTVRSAPAQPVTAGPAVTEPVMRRWPHPVDGAEPLVQGDPALHYIRCALSYQNQLLAEIKTLLEQMAEGTDGRTGQ